MMTECSQFEVLAEAENETELLAQLQKIQPSVIILDHDQPDAFSKSSIQRIKEQAPQARVLIISNDEDKESIYQVLQLGVNSFLTKTCGEEEIMDAVKATAKGEKFFCTRVLDYLLEKSFPSEAARAIAKEEVSCQPTPLSPREIEIVQLIASGLIAKEIASKLNLSTHTVYTHRKNIMKKLKLNSASELVLYAVNMGLVKS